MPADGVAAEIAADSRTPKERLGRLAELLERNGIAVEDIGRVRSLRLNDYQAMMKDADGEPRVVDLQAASIVISPSWEDGPKWPVVQQGPPVKVSAPAGRKATKSTAAADRWRTAVVLPDMQVGYYRDANDNLHPTHDEAALSVARQVLRKVKPDVLVLVGDNADFPELGKYRRTPAFQRTTQATVDRLTVLGGELRADVGPDCEIVWLAGNHEERLPNYIIDNAVAAFGIRQGNTPESWPVLSMPHLCRFDETGIRFLPGYPANVYWVNDRLRVIHGAKVRSNGSTAVAYLNDERVSTIYGHVHRREWAERTRATRDGARTILAASPGCLARIDGRVPSTKGGTDLDGIPMPSTEDWQQGCSLVTYRPGDGPFAYEQIAIHDGWAHWRGHDFFADDDAAARVHQADSG